MGYKSGVGREAPTFIASAVDGSEINLKQYRGDWFVVLVFLPTQSETAETALTQLSAAADNIWGMRGQLLGICDASRDECTTLAGKVADLAEGVAMARRSIDDGRARAVLEALVTLTNRLGAEADAAKAVQP